MQRTLAPRARFVLAIPAVVLITGCAASHHTATPGHESSATSGSPTTATAPKASVLPNPFTVTARYSAKSLGLSQPANLAIAPDGNLYITDASQHVTVISPNGKVLQRWGSRGTGPGQFTFVKNDPSAPGVKAAIAVGTNGLVYVADSGNARVQVFTPGGRFVRQFGSFGVGTHQFLFPEFLAVDGSGNVYVADDKKEVVSKFSPTGTFEWQIGGMTDADPDLLGHLHLTDVDSHDRIVAGNDDASRVVYVDSHGDKVDAFGAPADFRGGACDVSVGSAGDTFVNSCQEPLATPHYTEVFDRTHHLVGMWYPSPFGWAPRFGPNGEVFTLGDDGSILRLTIHLPDS